jgi:hypothetical protein
MTSALDVASLLEDTGLESANVPREKGGSVPADE